MAEGSLGDLSTRRALPLAIYSADIYWFSYLLDSAFPDNVLLSSSTAVYLGNLPPHTALDTFPEYRLILLPRHSEFAAGIVVGCILKPRRSSVDICCQVGKWQHLSTQNLF